jgi:putative iron-dependent peroxidase
MASPQTGIFALGTSSHAYLEFDVRATSMAETAVRRVAGLREPRTTIGGVNVVGGFRPRLWREVAPSMSPPGVTDFEVPIVGEDGYTLPATQHDIVIWLTGASYDVVFDLSHAIVRGLADCATLSTETVGWPYHHDLDATGFIDGTENPTLVEAMTVAIVARGSAGEGSSVLLLQRWEHDADAWEGLPTERQEAVIGRRRADSAELDPVPPASHVARTDQETFGKIFRRNIPYGSVSAHGTIFVGFSADQARFHAMLESMVGLGDGPRDDLTRFTRAVSGAYYVIPSVETLAAFGEGDEA